MEADALTDPQASHGVSTDGATFVGGPEGLSRVQCTVLYLMPTTFRAYNFRCTIVCVPCVNWLFCSSAQPVQWILASPKKNSPLSPLQHCLQRRELCKPGLDYIPSLHALQHFGDELRVPHAGQLQRTFHGP